MTPPWSDVVCLVGMPWRSPGQTGFNRCRRNRAKVDIPVWGASLYRGAFRDVFTKTVEKGFEVTVRVAVKGDANELDARGRRVSGLRQVFGGISIFDRQAQGSSDLR